MRKRAREKRAVVVGKTKSGKTAMQKKQVKNATKKNTRVTMLDTKEKRLFPYTNQYGSRS